MAAGKSLLSFYYQNIKQMLWMIQYLFASAYIARQAKNLPKKQHPEI
jgi:hypothetical protein